MAEVKFTIGGRSYRLSCRDGDEPALEAAAKQLDEKAEALLENLGALSESQLLLMAALQISGELLTAKEAPPEEKPAPAENILQALPDPKHLQSLIARVENLASRLEEAAANT